MERGLIAKRTTELTTQEVSDSPAARQGLLYNLVCESQARFFVVVHMTREARASNKNRKNVYNRCAIDGACYLFRSQGAVRGRQQGIHLFQLCLLGGHHFGDLPQRTADR